MTNLVKDLDHSNMEKEEEEGRGPRERRPLTLEVTGVILYGVPGSCSRRGRTS